MARVGRQHVILRSVGVARRYAGPATPAGEMMPEGASDGENRAAIQWELAGNAANSVSTKEFSAHRKE